MASPKRIEEITVGDLSQHRWCYFHDDEGGFDSFEWVIPETHPKFSEDTMQLELATFRFQGGEELAGMFDGAKGFSIFYPATGTRYGTASAFRLSRTKKNWLALAELGLQLPVNATAKWSGESERYNGIRYYDQGGNEMEATRDCLQ